MEEFRIRPVLKELNKNILSGGHINPVSPSLNSISCNQSGVNRKLANSNERQANLIINDRLVSPIKPIKSRFQNTEQFINLLK